MNFIQNRTRYFIVCLASLFLLTQQGAILHELSHIPEEIRQSQQKVPAHTDVCELCLAYAAIGAGLLPSIPLIAASDVAIVYVAEAQSSVISQPLLAYLSRAPPRLV
ncbi:MAG TPA: hypothetical protein VFW00_11355 [Rhodocyclaceae bacterium]|nr:hypothetical protein [Rhodocyclaceae bacterium]